jgi:hypothetical protein
MRARTVASSAAERSVGRATGVLILVLVACSPSSPRVEARGSERANDPRPTETTSQETTTNASSEAEARSRAETPLEVIPRAEIPRGRSGVGTNLTGIWDWGTEEPFVNALKMARNFVGGTPDLWRDGHTVSVDAHGWPRRVESGKVVRTWLYTDSGRYRPGRYTLAYEGTADLRYKEGARLVAEDSRPGRHVLELAPPTPGQTGLELEIHSIDPRAPLRNMRLYPPGGACDVDRTRYCDARTPCPSGSCLSFEEHADELVFHPDFLSRIRPFGMIRFMDWMKTNDSTIRRWEDRPRLDDATWSVKGVPVEILIRLTNQLRVQPWFCIPHEADDAYVRALAEALRDGVDPSLPIWVEYSNEIWNGIFGQHQYARRRGEELGLAQSFQAALRYQSRRSVEIFRIFEEVLGRERIVRVMAAQASNVWVAGELLRFENAVEHVDAIAIAPYFGSIVRRANASELDGVDVDGLVARTREQMIPQSIEWTRQHAELARRHGLQLVAYEAGQHYVGVEGLQDDARLNALFDAVNRDPRMRDLYLDYFEGWRAAGGGWINHFVNCDKPSKWGRWGALEHVRQPRAEAPKYDALLTFVERHPRGW